MELIKYKISKRPSFFGRNIVEDYENTLLPELTEEEQQRMKKAQELKEVLNDFMDKRKDLKEFEKELKKNKDMLTPGQVGDA